MEDSEKLIYRAKLAEQAERYKEMTELMKQAVLVKGELTDEERNLLSVGYKNTIGARRSAWRVIENIEQSSDGPKLVIIKEYKSGLEQEMDEICEEVQSLLTSLVDGSSDPSAKVFYLKMKGDYFRYRAEYKKFEDEEKNKAKATYEEAFREAEEGLEVTNPIRLGLALNFSVFYYEIINDHKQACKLAKDAFDNAITELDKLTDANYKDATLIMQLLRDNLTLWSSENDTSGDAKDEDQAD